MLTRFDNALLFTVLYATNNDITHTNITAVPYTSA